MSDRFWNKVQKANVNDCWHWLGYTAKDGYGHVRFNGNIYYAHRVASHLANGTPLKPKNQREGLILHKCGNRNCVNPAHLYTGTQRDNVQDTWDIGRTFIRVSVLYDEEVWLIKHLHSNGLPYYQIGPMFKLSASGVHRLATGRVTSRGLYADGNKTWKHNSK